MGIGRSKKGVSHEDVEKSTIKDECATAQSDRISIFVEGIGIS